MHRREMPQVELRDRIGNDAQNRTLRITSDDAGNGGDLVGE